MLNKLIPIAIVLGFMSTGASQASDDEIDPAGYSNTSAALQALLSDPDLMEKDRLMISAASQGSPAAAFEMGNMYYRIGDQDQALALYQDAARENYAPALHALAVHFMHGKENTDEHKTKVLNYLNNAAKQGYAPAQYTLGCLYGYHHVRFVEKDRKLQFYWIEQAANRGLPEAEYKLGRIYERPKSEFYDPQKAILWLSKAAGQPNSDAAYELGHIYERGRGVGKDLKAAIQFYEMAKKDGNKKAEKALTRLKVVDPEPSLASSLMSWWK